MVRCRLGVKLYITPKEAPRIGFVYLQTASLGIGNCTVLRDHYITLVFSLQNVYLCNCNKVVLQSCRIVFEHSYTWGKIYDKYHKLYAMASPQSHAGCIHEEEPGYKARWPSGNSTGLVPDFSPTFSRDLFLYHMHMHSVLPHKIF